MRSSAATLVLLAPAIAAFQTDHLRFISRLSRSRLSASSNGGEITRQFFFAGSATIASSLLFDTTAFADDIAAPPIGAAIYAYRSGGLARLTTLGIAKLITRYEGYVTAPKGYPKSQIPIAFDFPTDWLQLDKLGGGIQYVDQRNGDKLYVLHASLPEGSDLKSMNKQWFADVILSPDGDIARSGVVAEGGRISLSKMLVDCNAEDAPKSCMGRRRMILKYDTVTGSGVQTVERRGLVDAYQVGGDVYMMLTTSNAVKFDNKESRERETVENIANSFKVGDSALP